MSGLSEINFLKISGLIHQHKKTEFERAVKYACKMVSSECLERSLSAELLFGNEYYFFISWGTELALRSFILSNEYYLVRSAYDAMGELRKIEIGFEVEIKTIQIYHQ